MKSLSLQNQFFEQREYPGREIRYYAVACKSQRQQDHQAVYVN